MRRARRRFVVVTDPATGHVPPSQFHPRLFVGRRVWRRVLRLGIVATPFSARMRVNSPLVLCALPAFPPVSPHAQDAMYWAVTHQQLHLFDQLAAWMQTWLPHSRGPPTLLGPLVWGLHALGRVAEAQSAIDVAMATGQLPTATVQAAADEMDRVVFAIQRENKERIDAWAAARALQVRYDYWDIDAEEIAVCATPSWLSLLRLLCPRGALVLLLRHLGTRMHWAYGLASLPATLHDVHRIPGPAMCPHGDVGNSRSRPDRPVRLSAPLKRRRWMCLQPHSAPRWEHTFSLSAKTAMCRTAAC